MGRCDLRLRIVRMQEDSASYLLVTAFSMSVRMRSLLSWPSKKSILMSGYFLATDLADSSSHDANESPCVRAMYATR